MSCKSDPVPLKALKTLLGETTEEGYRLGCLEAIMQLREIIFDCNSVASIRSRIADYEQALMTGIEDQTTGVYLDELTQRWKRET